MAFDLIGRRSAALAAMLLVSVGLSACTTTEGTNAFTSFQTFDSEVMEPTAQGLGLVPAPVKPDPTNPRGPLVLPKDTSVLPPPTTDVADAQLPADSDKAKVDTTGLSAADIARLKAARVVDINTPDGRPLTKEELAKLTAKMKEVELNGKKSIFVPPEEYFEVGSATKQDLVCLAADGDLVAVSDPKCPIEIRKALLKQT
ncbi:MAG TPA: hypothetical protein VHZ56_09795 [Devosia sp.]|jgi:hypothetical protein|nr:hypothetical protein [Devosia sp.]